MYHRITPPTTSCYKIKTDTMVKATRFQKAQLLQLEKQ
jgi:hypothetical protein